ncbi:hypothetical protein H2199_008335 [Coniosporium tulheliwenetii]|uniref:Uncharacterized protein n=1 Tax=Coniosporium tulheliwenetii TaxID=3383036 RepID=A0ACC2YKV3_9PEZI|nr:hypothetical protein H2199_008335 [Cladosporium sp. JES 115]
MSQASSQLRIMRMRQAWVEEEAGYMAQLREMLADRDRRTRQQERERMLTEVSERQPSAGYVPPREDYSDRSPSAGYLPSRDEYRSQRPVR